MNKEMIVGLIVTFVPLFAFGYLMLRKQASIFRFFIAMLLVGLGYLTATGAINDIGAQALRHTPAVLQEPATIPVTAPTTAPVAAPAK